MHRQLFIIRHGSSPLSHSNISDFDRTLDVQGINDSALISRRLLDNDSLPDKILSSSAIRALHSAIIFAQTFKYPLNNISIDDEIYLADKNIMLKIIKRTDNKYKNLMIFGHNPTFTDLANHFLKNKISSMPTSSIVGLHLEIESWSEIGKVKAVASFFNQP